MNEVVASFVENQLQLLDIEKDAEAKESEILRQTKSAKELERLGFCLTKLRIAGVSTGLGGRSLLKVESSRGGTGGEVTSLPAHKFSSGDIVSIQPSHATLAAGDNNNSNSSNNNPRGLVCRVSPTRITIAFDEYYEEIFNYEHTVVIHKLANDITYKRMKDSLLQLQQNKSSTSDNIKSVIFEGKEPSFLQTPFGGKESDTMNMLNDPQKQAIKFAVSANEIALIHGPPGTGKTTTVVEFIRQVVSTGAKVLACGPSNMSVDNMLQLLVSQSNTTSKPVRCIRIGHPARVMHHLVKYSLDHVSKNCDSAEITRDIRAEIASIHKSLKGGTGTRLDSAARAKLRNQLRDLYKDLRTREERILRDIFVSTDVVLATNTGAADYALREYNEFDWVVIDEAAQALEASCWIPIIKGKKLLLAGDHCQLPPTIHSIEAEQKGLSDTLFGKIIRNFGDKVAKLLCIQYRMHDKIKEWSSQEFYHGKLLSHYSVANHLLHDIVKHTGEDSYSLLDVPMLLIDTSGCNMEESREQEGESISNENEVGVVVKHVQRLMEAGVHNSLIGVITPYNAQVNSLRAALQSVNVEVATVDGFQGREKEAIVISMVRSNPPPHNVGFLKDDRRTNVAITRARRHVCVVCDSATVGSHAFLKRMAEYFKKHAVVLSATDYLEYKPEDILYDPATQQGDDDGENASPSVKTTTKNRASHNKKPKKNSQTQPQQPTIEQKKEAWRKQLIELRDKIGKYSILNSVKFPTSINSYERMVLHELATELGLAHASIGEDKERHLVITRVDVQTGVNNDQIEVKEEELAKKKRGKKQNNNKDLFSEELDLAQNVDEEPVQEQEQEGEGEGESSAQQKKPKKKKKKKKSAGNSEPKVEEHNVVKAAEKERPERGSMEDIDDALKQLGIDNSRCRIKDCKNNVLISRTCEFCRYKYCLYHGMPEAHGCGDEAKKKARSDWLKQKGPNEGKATKPLKDWERDYLKNKLHKKIDEDTKSRTSKAPAKKKK